MGSRQVSVILLTWNGLQYVQACLEALLAQEPPAFELLVVDNGSTDGTPELVEQRFSDVRLIRNGRNLGFAAGNNIGLRAATGEVLVLLNQDTQVHPRFLGVLADTFKDPAVGIVGCKLLYPDGTIQHAGGYVYGSRGETGHTGWGALDDGRFDKPNEPEFVTAAAVGISRTCLNQVGLLDEGFAPAYYEDVDWCYRTRAAGFRILYQPQAVATHHESTATAPDSHMHKFAWNQGRVRFLLKHRSLEQLLHDFGPAELAWIRGMGRTEETMGARRAYLVTLLALSDILTFRGSSQAEAEALVGLLADLRAGAVHSLETLSQAGPLIPAEEEAPVDQAASPPEPDVGAHKQAVPGRAFAGPGVIARLRRFWQGVRYLDVLPDLVDHVRQHEDHQVSFRLRLDRLEGETRSQARDVAENVRELNALAEHIARHEVAPEARPSPAEDVEG